MQAVKFRIISCRARNPAESNIRQNKKSCTTFATARGRDEKMSTGHLTRCGQESIGDAISVTESRLSSAISRGPSAVCSRNVLNFALL